MSKYIVVAKDVDETRVTEYGCKENTNQRPEGLASHANFPVNTTLTEISTCLFQAGLVAMMSITGGEQKNEYGSSERTAHSVSNASRSAALSTPRSIIVGRKLNTIVSIHSHSNEPGRPIRIIGCNS